MITYANFIKPNIVLFEMFSNITKHKITLTEQNKYKNKKNKRNPKMQMVIFDQVNMMPTLDINADSFPN